jgi:hypothetical protein
MRRVMHEAFGGCLAFPDRDKLRSPCFACQPCQVFHPSLHVVTDDLLIFKMSEKLEPLAGEDSKDSPPAYEAAALEHGVRSGPPTPGSKPLPRGPFPLDIPVLNQLRGKRVILASASPRRKQILSTVHSPTSWLRCRLI